MRLLQQRDCRLGVECGETERLRLLGERGREHVDLLVDHGLGFRSLEGNPDVVLLRRLFRAGFDGLPELVLEAFRDERNVGFVRARKTCPANERANADHDTD